MPHFMINEVCQVNLLIIELYVHIPLNSMWSPKMARHSALDGRVVGLNSDKVCLQPVFSQYNNAQTQPLTCLFFPVV